MQYLIKSMYCGFVRGGEWPSESREEFGLIKYEMEMKQNMPVLIHGDLQRFEIQIKHSPHRWMNMQTIYAAEILEFTVYKNRQKSIIVIRIEGSVPGYHMFYFLNSAHADFAVSYLKEMTNPQQIETKSKPLRGQAKER